MARRKPVRVSSGPQLRLGCGIPTVAWSPTHHLLACAGYGGPGAPLLVYILDVSNPELERIFLTFLT